MATKKKVAATKQAVVTAEVAAQLGSQIAQKLNEVAKLRETLGQFERTRNSEVEKKFEGEVKQLRKEIAPQIAAIKAARKEIASLAEKAQVPVTYEDEIMTHVYIPKSFKKRVETLSEDFLDEFCSKHYIDYCELVDAHAGWHGSYS